MYLTTGDKAQIDATCFSEIRKFEKGTEGRREVLPYGETIDSDLDRQQLTRLQSATELVNRKSIVF